jgi:hypothetical protein
MKFNIPKRGAPPAPPPTPSAQRSGKIVLVAKPKPALNASAFNRSGSQTLDDWEKQVQAFQDEDASKEALSTLGKSIPRPRSGKPITEGAVHLNMPPEALSGVTANVEELLDRHPLPLTPDGRVFTLKGWQVEDIQTLAQWDRVGVFLPVGAGKTVVATLVALAYGDPAVVVLVPPILVKQWVRWLNSVGNSGGAVAYQGSPSKRKDIELRKFRWWVMSYQIFKNDFHHLLKAAPLKDSVTTIVDEAQGLKNTGSKLYKHVQQFSLGRRLIMMTGTELNKPDDAYAYIQLKTPGVYRSYGHFTDVHGADKDFWGTLVRWRELKLLNRNLYLQSVQRTKEQVHAHLPEAHYIPFPYELAPEHKRLYKELVEKQILEIEGGGKFDATTSQALHNYSQQIVVNWAHFAGDPSLRPAAFDVIDHLIDVTGFGQPGGPTKFIVWTWFTMTTKLVLDYLNSLFPGRAVAAYSEGDSRKAVDAFMEDPEIGWLVANPGSAGAGLNPQYICYNALFLETPTRTIPFRQAAGRIDREGQQLNANIWIAQAEGTIQMSLYQNLLSNDALVQQVQGNAKDLRKVIYGEV